jgi:L-histidine N-alpha-methyltransferase
MLEASAEKLRAKYDGLEIVSIAADYTEGLARLREFDKRPELILWLGSSIGNFERGGAVAFLRSITVGLTTRDRLLIGFDLVKDLDVLKKAYNDSRGVTAAFNLNLLARINRELGGTFDIDSFEHIAEYNTEKDRIEMYLVSKRDQDVAIKSLGRTFHFEKGERIHTENSHKYTQAAIKGIADEVGLHIIRQWNDPKDWFNLTLFALAR